MKATKQCSKCGEHKALEEFRPGRNICKECERLYARVYYQTPEGKAKQEIWNQSSKGKSRKKVHSKKFDQSSKGKSRKKVYEQGIKGKATVKKYLESPKGKSTKKASMEVYAQTPEGKASQKSWQRSPAGKAAKKKYRESPKGKSKERGYNKSLKGKAAKKINIANRRARKLELPNTLTNEQWDYAIKSFGGGCAACGDKPDDSLHADHWIPLSYKGDDNPGTVAANIVPLCRYCNCSKNATMPGIWLSGNRKGRQINTRIQTYFDSLQMGDRNA